MKKKAVVNVLISTYNGERYIEEQIESILNQTYPYIKIYIRDDGSKDKTVNVIEKYINNPQVFFLKGENIGYAKGFMELLKISEEGDYWAFCDQDDVWLPEKIEWAVNWLEEQNCLVPALFHSAFQNVDMELNNPVAYVLPKYKYDFRRALTECLYFGFSMVFNAALRTEMMKGDFEHIVSHDWWATLIVIKFGITMFDNRIASRHRRHSESVTLKTKSKKIKWLFRSLSEGNIVGNNAKEYLRVFKDQLTSQEKFLLKLFIEKKVMYNAIKAFYPKRWRPTWDSELAIRLLMLLGKN